MSEIDSRVVVDSSAKRLQTAVSSDATFQLGGHSFALTRALSQEAASGSNAQNGSSGDFGNWTLPLLDTHLTTDQDGLTPLGALAPWVQGARVWLQMPASLSQADAGTQYLSFTLQAQDVALAGNATAARVVTRPVFTTSDGWTLTANDGDPTQAPALQRQGQHLYDQVSGLPWQPRGFELTAPDGTRYQLDAQGQVQQVHFADGQQWLVSDAGITLAGSADVAQRVEFRRDSTGRISLVTGPLAGGGATSVSYSYDAQGRLVLARQLYSSDTGTQYGYGEDGALIDEPITAELGSAVDWSAGVPVRSDSWSGALVAGAAVNVALSVGQSEVDSTV
jgi:YD repeat-containing protein